MDFVIPDEVCIQKTCAFKSLGTSYGEIITSRKKKKKHKKNMYVTLNKHPLPLIVAVSLVNAEEGHSSTVQRIAEYCTRMSGHFPCFLSRQSS